MRALEGKYVIAGGGRIRGSSVKGGNEACMGGAEQVSCGAEKAIADVEIFRTFQIDIILVRYC